MAEIRDITAKDVFGMVQVLNKIGIAEFKDVFNSDEVRDAIAGATVNGKIDPSKFSGIGISVAIEIAGVLVKNLGNAEDAIFKFLASLTGMQRRELENMAPAEFMQLIVDIVRKPEFKDFIGVVSKLFS